MLSSGMLLRRVKIAVACAVDAGVIGEHARGELFYLLHSVRVSRSRGARVADIGVVGGQEHGREVFIGGLRGNSGHGGAMVVHATGERCR